MSTGGNRAVKDLEPFFSPQSVAVGGASRDTTKVGYAIVDSLVKGGFEGDIYPVNPGADLTEGTVQRLRDGLPPAANANNPVDVPGDALAPRYRLALGAVLEDPRYFAYIQAFGHGTVQKVANIDYRQDMAVVG